MSVKGKQFFRQGRPISHSTAPYEDVSSAAAQPAPAAKFPGGRTALPGGRKVNALAPAACLYAYSLIFLCLQAVKGFCRNHAVCKQKSIFLQGMHRVSLLFCISLITTMRHAKKIERRDCMASSAFTAGRQIRVCCSNKAQAITQSVPPAAHRALCMQRTLGNNEIIRENMAIYI